MASIEVLQAHYDSCSLRSNDFSILSYPEQPIQNGDLYDHFHENLNLTNMLSASVQDTSIDIQIQLNELISENIRLKEKLSKSNSLMEAQIVNVQSWRNNILTSKNQLEKNLSEANEKIALLEKENADLLEKITNASERIEERNAKTCRKCTKLDTDLTAMLGMDYCLENQHLIMGWYYFDESLSENLKKICKQLEVSKSNSSLTMEEKYTLECYILMLQFKIAFLEGNDMPQAQVDLSLKTDEETGYEVVCKKRSEAEKTIQELTEKVQEKDNQLASEMKEKEKFIEMIKAFELRIEEMKMAFKRQYEDMTNKLKIESDLTQRYRERCDNFEQQITEYEKKLDETRARMSDFNRSKQDDRVKERQELQEIFKQEQTLNLNDREKFLEVMEKCEKLQVEYEGATQLLEIQLKEEKEKNEKLASCEHDVKKYLENADRQTAKLFATQEQLMDVTREMIRLERELDDMKDKKKIEILKQVSSSKNVNPERERAAFQELERLKNQFKGC